MRHCNQCGRDLEHDNYVEFREHGEDVAYCLQCTCEDCACVIPFGTDVCDACLYDCEDTIWEE